MAKELGRGDAEKAFPKPKYKYLRDEPITLQGWDGYALDIEGDAGAGVMMRTYIAKDRLFRLLVTVGRRGQQNRRQSLPRFAEAGGDEAVGSSRQTSLLLPLADSEPAEECRSKASISL